MDNSKIRGPKVRFLGFANISGHNIKKYRENLVPKCSQNDLANKLQLAGYSIHKNTIQKIEQGEREVNDIELRLFAQVLNVTVDDLIDITDLPEKAKTPEAYSNNSYNYGLRNIADKPIDN